MAGSDEGCDSEGCGRELVKAEGAIGGSQSDVSVWYLGVDSLVGVCRQLGGRVCTVNALPDTAVDGSELAEMAVSWQSWQ